MVFPIKRRPIMKPVATIVVVLLTAISIAGFAETDFSGGHHCRWGNHPYLVEHHRLHCPCCTGVHVVAGK